MRGVNYSRPADLLRNNGRRNEPKTQCRSLRVKSLLHAVSMAGFVLEKDGLVIGLLGRDQVIHDARQFVCAVAVMALGPPSLARILR